MPGIKVNSVGNQKVPTEKQVVSLLEPIGFLRWNRPFTPSRRPVSYIQGKWRDTS